jgi:alanyl aminopeptidase
LRIKYALSLTPAIVRQLEKYYGIAYPYQKLDVLAVPDFAAGAMENAGAVTFREQLLLMDDNAPLEQRRSSLSVQAHELAHQWFGDLVTPKWWDDIWLNESFATWMSAKIANDVKPDQEFGRRTLGNAETVMRLDELPSARQVHNPVHTPDDLANAFDDITYSKGAAVLAMFENYVGADAWQKGIHAYLKKYAFKNATADDFIGTIAQTTKRPEIVAAFHSFIDQPGIPLLTTRKLCKNGKANLVVTQTQYAPVGIKVAQGKWDVPYCADSDGKKICHIVQPPKTEIALGGACSNALYPNAKGTGYYRFTAPDEKWQSWIERASGMSAEDQYTLFHDVDAGLRGDYATANDYFSTIKALAPHATWDLLDRGLIDSLHDLRVTGVVSGDDLAKLQAFIRTNFSDRMTKLGIAAKPGEPAADTLSRVYLAQLLVEEGNDTALINKLSKAAQAYLKSDGKDYGGMAPELLKEAMRAGVMSQGAPFVDKLIGAMKASDDEYFVQSVIYAVAGSIDPASLKKMLDLSLTPDMRIGDMRYVWRYFEEEAAARPILWDWFKSNFDALKTRLSAQGFSGGPSILRYGCDENAKTELDAFFGPKTSELEGTVRTLKQNDDRIDRCVAFKQAKADEIATALNAMR